MNYDHTLLTMKIFVIIWCWFMSNPKMLQPQVLQKCCSPECMWNNCHLSNILCIYNMVTDYAWGWFTVCMLPICYSRVHAAGWQQLATRQGISHDDISLISITLVMTTYQSMACRWSLHVGHYYTSISIGMVSWPSAFYLQQTVLFYY